MDGWREAFWKPLVSAALQRWEPPFYVFSPRPFEAAWKRLESALVDLPIPHQHWLSFKTQPVPRLLQWWRDRGQGVEVVSEFEYRAALRAGFPAERILLNGPAKHRWLPACAVPGLNVNFDSAAEAEGLAELAKSLDWKLGVRFLTSLESDLEGPQVPTQFGVAPEELEEFDRVMVRHGLSVETVHIHLRTNVGSPEIYRRALVEARGMAGRLGLTVRRLDCGGGLPPGFVTNHQGQAYNKDFDLNAWAAMLCAEVRRWPQLEALWLENGRFLSAGSGVLAVRILDAKERRGMRQLVCNGGRTNNALVATWEDHGMFSLPERSGGETLTTVTGPTCMAFDRLVRRPLPRSLMPGDVLVWMDAGAYHISWENHFSHGLARVLWDGGGGLEMVREPEDFDHWWSRWRHRIGEESLDAGSH